MQLRRIAENLGCSLVNGEFDRDTARNRGAQQIAGLAEQRGQRESLDALALPAAESEYLLHQPGRALRRHLNRRQALVYRLPVSKRLPRQHDVAEDRAEDVVEVVRDPAGQRADRLHFLRLA